MNSDILLLLFCTGVVKMRSVSLLRSLWLSRERKSLSDTVPVAGLTFSAAAGAGAAATAVMSTRTLREPLNPNTLPVTFHPPVTAHGLRITA